MSEKNRTSNSVTQPRTNVDRLRRGLCLLNASLYDDAINELSQYSSGLTERLPAKFPAQPVADPEAIESLRADIARNPEDQHAHFQLGTLLMAANQWDEAELRFTQVLSIDRDHVDALTGLARCHLNRCEFAPAVNLLQRAQAARPSDASITLLLAEAARDARDSGSPVHVCAAILDDASIPF